MKLARALSEAMISPIVIIVDALDESGDTDSRRVLLGNAITDSCITDLPPNLRILLTSRPLPDIQKALNDGTPVRQKSMDSVPSGSTKSDILCYVLDELFEVDFERPSEEVFASLTGSSGQCAIGLCIYQGGRHRRSTGTTEALQCHHRPQRT